MQSATRALDVRVGPRNAYISCIGRQPGPDQRRCKQQPRFHPRSPEAMAAEEAEEADRDLMTRVAAGDRDAVGAVYDRYVTLVLPVALRILGSPADAEDVVHDVFATLPDRARHYVAERGSVVAWLVILVRNMSLDRIRRRAVRQALNHESLQAAQPGAPTAQDPESAIDIVSRGERVRRALEALPAAQRATLIAAFFEGLSYAEIAARDGVPLGTVKSRAARAITALREALCAAGPMEPLERPARDGEAP
jgi:RNA polymerase sigma-70 factor (ECF subfamily)